jgi:hypothetical protein
MSFEIISEFEKSIAKFFGSPYAVAVDSCTHGVELCLRHTQADHIIVPKNTYLSIPFLANKLWIDLLWKNEDWVDYYYLTENVIDAAVLWKPKSYVPGTFMNLSFQYQKSLSFYCLAHFCHLQFGCTLIQVGHGLFWFQYWLQVVHVPYH